MQHCKAELKSCPAAPPPPPRCWPPQKAADESLILPLSLENPQISFLPEDPDDSLPTDSEPAQGAKRCRYCQVRDPTRSSREKARREQTNQW